ncbi:helix-hairpin-helix domain-containing protein [haloarchaeon 3A1-DGR]|nr:helix-hairpin-helix domain-containing protein [haloarchaeon 3A1-DGR]
MNADDVHQVGDVVEVLDELPVTVTDTRIQSGPESIASVTFRLDEDSENERTESPTPRTIDEDLEPAVTAREGDQKEEQVTPSQVFIRDVVSEHEGVGTSVVDRLEEAGYETLADIQETTVEDLTDINYVGAKKASTILEITSDARPDGGGIQTPPVEDPDPPHWTPDTPTNGEIVTPDTWSTDDRASVGVDALQALFVLVVVLASTVILGTVIL